MNRESRTATITVQRTRRTWPRIPWKKLSRPARDWWPLQMARELDDAILCLRTNELELGLWIFKTAGNPEAVLATDAFI